MDCEKKSNSEKKIDYYNYSANFLRSHDLIRSADHIRNHIDGDVFELISQVEFQPGHHCDLFKCNHCYGRGQKTLEGNLDFVKYVELLEDIKNYDVFIQISGVTTEPLTYPYIYELIEEVKRRKFNCGLHTKGYRLTPEISDILTNDVGEEESFVTISVDSGRTEDYISIHGLDTAKNDSFGRNAEDYFEVVTNNIKILYEKKIAKNSKLRVNIAYLLFERNCSEEKVKEFVDEFYDYSDVIRLSLPQVTNNGCSSGYVERACEIINKFRSIYLNDPKIIILPFAEYRHLTHFRKCYAQRYQAVIDRCGNVFPCPQTALKEYSQLIYGNLNTDSFTNIISSNERITLFGYDVDRDMNCRICDRKDEDINIMMGKLLE